MELKNREDIFVLLQASVFRPFARGDAFATADTTTGQVN